MWQEHKPLEELYDLQADPYEVNNLAASRAHQEVLQELRVLLDGWIASTGGQGAHPDARPCQAG